MTFTPVIPGTGTTGSGQFPTNPMANLPSTMQPYATTTVPGLMGYRPGTNSINPNVSGVPGVTFTKALNTLLTHDDRSKILQVQQKLIQAGYLNPEASGFTAGSVSSSDLTYSAYAQALTDAIEKQKPLQQILNDRINDPNNTTGQGYWQQYQVDQTNAGTGTSGTQVSTTSSVNLTDGQDARALAQNEYQSLLGRNVTNKEAKAFAGALDAYESAHPNVTTDTASGTTANATHSETTSGGIDQSGAAQLADQRIIQNHGKEYANTQGDQLMSLFQNIIGGNG